MLCLPSIISLCLLLLLDNLRYTVCCLGLAGEVMIVLVLIVVMMMDVIEMMVDMVDMDMVDMDILSLHNFLSGRPFL